MSLDRFLDILAYYLTAYWWAVIPLLAAASLFLYRSTLSGDARRNFLSGLTEKFSFTPRFSMTLFDLRVGFKRDGKWIPARLYAFQPVKQNFWNAIFAFQIYVTIPQKFPFPFPRIAISSRYSKSSWFQTHIGWLFDRGEFAVKLVLSSLKTDAEHNPGVNAEGWEEGGI